MCVILVDQMSVVNVEQYFSYMHDNNVGTIPLGGPVDGDEVCHRIIRQSGHTDNFHFKGPRTTIHNKDK